MQSDEASLFHDASLCGVLPKVALGFALSRQWWHSMEGIDLVLTPALSENPAPLDSLTYAACGSDLDRWVERGYRFAPFAVPANLAGQPSAVLPISLTDTGLPVAVQITDRPDGDALVLRVSNALEDAIGWAGLGLI
ncbi:amidase family protein [Cypionkella psychrotolerans]|uniref:amidase family protein n=1 Tax=Cypionkella psychrotolerans TaxID=1678131 RepID=UPI0006B61CF1|nr:amidase family protein [Cypionkella psychrotolerans]